MGQTKRLLDQHEEQLELGRRICLDADVLKHCDGCDDDIDNGCFKDQAYEEVEAILNNPNDDRYDGYTFEELKVCIDLACDNATQECICTHRAHKD